MTLPVTGRAVRIEQLGSHWMHFLLNLVFEDLFRKSVTRIQVSLKSDKNNGYFI